VHHFATKEALVSAILNGVRDRLRTMRQRMGEEAVDPLWGVWHWTASREHEALFRFFFEAYGVALRDPERYATFLERVVSDWIDPHDAVAATLELAVL
jgi:AcrR family transcriptional regulator